MPIQIKGPAQRDRPGRPRVGGTRAPMLWPTSAVAAIEKPKAAGTRPTSAVKAICCAASADVPIRATTAISVMNAPREDLLRRRPAPRA